MDMPEVKYCCGVFPPKYACFLISVFGIGCGGVGLAGIIIYGLAEDSITAHLGNPQNIDPTMKKVVLTTIGLTSLLLLVSNIFLFFGFTSSAVGLVGAAKWVTFFKCMLILLKAMLLPISCLLSTNTCVIKKLTAPFIILGYLALAIYVKIWLYFMVMMYNFQIQL